ncbi:MAG: low molecular weight protein-tyrosine-phosphatase [Chromatiales bacterium]
MNAELYQSLFFGHRRTPGTALAGTDGNRKNKAVVAAFDKILVVCLGNICRSPIAQAMLARGLRVAGYGNAEVQSAGLNALVGYPADLTAQKTVRKFDIDLSSHRARQLNGEMIRWADLVLVMENEQKKHVHLVDPTARGKVFRLGEWSDFDVQDPYGRSVAAFEKAVSTINKGVSDWVQKLKG